MSIEAQEGEDAYGPGSDLMISLFAIAILLLAIVGVGQQFGAVEQAAKAASAGALPPPSSGEVRKIPPLKLSSAQQLADAEARRRDAEARLAELVLAQGRDRTMIDLLNGRLSEMKKALEEAYDRLNARNQELPAGRLEILSQAFPVSVLAPFLDDPSALSMPLDVRDVTKIKAATKPFVPHANQIFIETAVPPQLLAFLPPSLDSRMAINRVYLLSAAIGQAYQQALARNHVPLACISLVVRSFEDAPDVRRQAVFDAADAVDVFAELFAFYAPMDRQQAGQAEAHVRILLGASDDRPCDSEMLEARLSNLKPE